MDLYSREFVLKMLFLTMSIVLMGSLCFQKSTVYAGITDPTKVLPEPSYPLPKLLDPYLDPTFNTEVVRAVSAKAEGASRMGPEYSQLQAWNSNQSLMLLGGQYIVDSSTYDVVHRISIGWPAWGEGIRWSPTEPDSLYYTGGDQSGCSGAVFMRYRLQQGSSITARKELVGCFPEYDEIDGDASYEELSNNGRFVGLVGVRPDGSREIFAYDIKNKVKRKAMVAPRDLDWVAVSPSGKYMLVLWAGGGPWRYNGLEAYDLDMKYLDKVHTGTGHSDVCMDKNGSEWLVVTNANNAYLLSDNHYLVKAKIPRGVVIDGNNNVDEAATLAKGLTVPLLRMNWFISIHISCRNINAPDWCVVTGEGGPSKWQPFQDEIFRLYLNSTANKPRVERLVHHRSSLSDYWATPFATASPDGKKIVYGSDWERTSSIDAYVISNSGSIDLTPPSPPTNLRIIYP
jgi:hypothetical protein